ncbi:MAG: fimbrillin family protein [Bacteroidaceae bacterium]
MRKSNYLRFLLATALTAALTAACSDSNTPLGDEPDTPEQPSTPEPKRVPITFTTTVDTKGTELNNDNFTAFTLFALNQSGEYLEGITETGATYTKGADGTWTTPEGITWPTDGSKVAFYAINGNEVKAGEEFDKENKTFHFVVDEDVNNMDDILVCYLTDQTQPPTGESVVLRFSHLTMALQFKITNKLSSKTIHIKEVVLRNVAYMADYRFADGTLTLGSDKTHYTLLTTSSETGLTIPAGEWKIVYGTDYPATGTSHYLYVLPQTTTAWDKTTAANASGQTGTYLYIRLRVDGTSTDQEIAIPIGATWTANGNKLYNININSTAIGMDGQPFTLKTEE